MSVTVTLHLWWLWAYLALGLLLWIPMEWWAYRHSTWRNSGPFWSVIWGIWTRRFKQSPLETVAALLIPIALWPLALWEVLT